MTFRATTHEQFRIVLKWVKEHPVLAKNDNEVEKGGRELKNKLWEKLAIELNELGPPIRSGMAWKRVLTDYKYSLKKKIQRRIANTTQGGSEILASLSELETEALQASLLDWDFSDPEKLAQLAAETPPADDSQSLQKSPDDTSNHDSFNNQSFNGSVEEMDSMNAENLNGNDSSTMMQSVHDSLEVKMEIGDLENDQSLLNGKVQAQVTIPSPNSKNMPRGENYIQLQTVAAEDLSMNGESQMKVEEPEAQNVQQLTVQGQQLIPISEGSTQPNNMFSVAPETQSIIHSMMMANATPKEYSDVLNAAILAQSPQFIQQQQSQAQQQHLQPQQLTQLQQQLSQPQQQQLNQQQQQQHQLNQHNQQQQQMQQQHQMHQQQQMQQQHQQQHLQQQQMQQQQQQMQQQQPQVPNQILQQHLQSQQHFQSTQQQQTVQHEQPVSNQQQTDQQQTTAQSQSNSQQQPDQQQPQQQQQTNSEQQTPALTPEVMNSLIAREIDRMAVAQKSRKTQQRKRETREKTKPAQEAAPPPEPKPAKERARKPPAEPSDRTKRPPPKRPRPKPKETKEPVVKKFMRGREFRECLLKLLVEANEMEKRRIAIAETKVRNQTEIQNLEITRMNLEIMKLQKEITLLDHGAKILP